MISGSCSGNSHPKTFHVGSEGSFPALRHMVEPLCSVQVSPLTSWVVIVKHPVLPLRVEDGRCTHFLSYYYYDDDYYYVK